MSRPISPILQRQTTTLATIVLTLLMAFTLASCATAMSYDDYLGQYGEMTEKELLQAWGTPQSRQEEDGQVRLVYTSTGMRNVMVSPAIYEPYFDGRNVHHRIVQPERWRQEQTHCKTIFVFEQGQMLYTNYEGNGCIAPN